MAARAARAPASAAAARGPHAAAGAAAGPVEAEAAAAAAAKSEAAPEDALPPTSTTHHSVREGGLRVSSTQLTARIQATPMAGETNREKSPSGAHTPSLNHVVPPITPSTTT